MNNSTRLKPVLVYFLYDVRDPAQTPRYVGQTTMTLRKRLANHRGTARTGGASLVHQWMYEVGDKNVEIALVEICSFADRTAAEARWTEELRTSVEFGGLNECLAYRKSESTRAKMSAAQIIRFSSAEARSEHGRKVAAALNAR